MNYPPSIYSGFVCSHRSSYLHLQTKCLIISSVQDSGYLNPNGFKLASLKQVDILADIVQDKKKLGVQMIQ